MDFADYLFQIAAFRIGFKVDTALLRYGQPAFEVTSLIDLLIMENDAFVNAAKPDPAKEPELFALVYGMACCSALSQSSCYDLRMDNGQSCVL